MVNALILLNAFSKGLMSELAGYLNIIVYAELQAEILYPEKNMIFIFLI